MKGLKPYGTILFMCIRLYNMICYIDINTITGYMLYMILFYEVFTSAEKVRFIFSMTLAFKFIPH